METMEIGLGFGSNIGDKAARIREAAAALSDDGVVTGMTLSSLYRTAPWGTVLDQDWFVNACAIGRTALSPADLLSRCKAVEKKLGRTGGVRWGPRIIDIDVLFYGDLDLATPGLILPHKDLLNRGFVLVPLAELCPDRLIRGQTLRAAAKALGTTGIERFPA